MNRVFKCPICGRNVEINEIERQYHIIAARGYGKTFLTLFKVARAETCSDECAEKLIRMCFDKMLEE